MWPFDDGVVVAWASGDEAASVLMFDASQGYDGRLRRWVARLPGVVFPITMEGEMAEAVRKARALFAEHGAA
jgi:hypothetical protein